MPNGGHAFKPTLSSPARHTTQAHYPPQGHVANMSSILPNHNTSEIQATINKIENLISSNNCNPEKIPFAK